MLKLADPIIKLDKLGEKTALKLNSIGIYTLEHLLFYLPNRYQNKTKLSNLEDAEFGDEVLLEMKIISVNMNFGGRQQLFCHLEDDEGEHLVLRFFHFSEYHSQQLVRGEIIQCFGELKVGRQTFEMVHPEYRILSKQKPILQPTLTPIYPLTAGIKQANLQVWIDTALEVLQSQPLDDLPIDGLPNLTAALAILHHPTATENLDDIANFRHPAQKRLIIEEFSAHQISLLRLKKNHKNNNAQAFLAKNKLQDKLLKSLNFQLTNAQNRVIKEIVADTKTKQPMLRLLQGDVGSGKTIVAIFTCLLAIENGVQAAVMTPTEILAEQHLRSFTDILTPLGVKIAFLSGVQNTEQKNHNLDLIKSGQAQVIIGTHALFQASVKFKKLGLVVIDEQHKFGVHQRLLLAKKAIKTPHQLVMTATPIPRSLTMTAYADLDASIIDELPPGRKPIQTIVLSVARKTEVLEKIRQVCKAGQQVFWVATLIEESEVLRAESAKNIHNFLKENLPELSVELIHGKIKADEKEQIMQNFVAKKIAVLVATIVIEVGVDVPNASLIVIENAERLGLAQLHQLRGRVGRGADKSICILMYQPELSENAKQRLGILRQTCDGFLIAEKDLELRGPGEVLGTEQAGIANMKIANIVRDYHLFPKVKKLSTHLLTQPESTQLTIINRWINTQQKS